ncbi:transcriptional regulator PpsR [Rhodobacteraceae bacterium CCMM004]|nr:transcriptional regulator PpsR [Rhodobacteraceae bacterium CCMM004]
MSSRGTKYWSAGAIPLIAPELLGDIIATASDIAVVVSDVGHILSVLVNPNHTTFGHLDDWEGRDIRDVLTVESVSKLEQKLRAVGEGKAGGRPVELNHTGQADLQFPIRYTFHSIGPDGAILMLGRDLRPIAEMQQQIVQTQLALERDYELQREFDTKLRVLMEASRDPVMFVSLGKGRIADLNGAAASLLGGTAADLGGGLLTDAVHLAGRGELLEALASAAMAETTQPVTAVSRRNGGELRLVPRMFRAAGERMLLCRLETDEQQFRSDAALADNLLAYYRSGTEGIVFTDRSGTILAVNDAFLGYLALANPSKIKGQLLADFFSRGSVDAKVLIENALRTGHMRLYLTKLTGDLGTEVSVEVSATYLDDRKAPCIVFVFRDAARAETLRTPGTPTGEDGVRSVMELVGSSSLKDIVSETTDVVERMCIETAIELTNNNRVAAAEMLGLSRQSLYVKLRKYGLLARGD